MLNIILYINDFLGIYNNNKIIIEMSRARCKFYCSHCHCYHHSAARLRCKVAKTERCLQCEIAKKHLEKGEKFGTNKLNTPGWTCKKVGILYMLK